MPTPSRTPEGDSVRCHVCGKWSSVEASWPGDDATCPFCGTLLWIREADRKQKWLVRSGPGRFEFEVSERRESFRHLGGWGARLRKAGVCGGFFSVLAFFALFVFAAAIRPPDGGFPPAGVLRVFMTCVLAVGCACLLSLLAIFVGGMANSVGKWRAVARGHR